MERIMEHHRRSRGGRTWLAVAAIAVIFSGAFAGIQYARRDSQKADASARTARRVAEVVEAKQKAFDEAAAEAQAKRDRESTEVAARQRDAELAEEERKRTAAAEAIRKANDERREAEERSARQRDAAAKLPGDSSKPRTAGEEPGRREAAAPFPIGSYWQADGDCQPRPTARVAIIRPPTYGKVESRAETIVAEKSRTGRCVGTRQNAITLHYSPSNAAATEDRLSIEVRYESATRTFDCVVNVRERVASCKST
jgi:hypothetical protein